MTLKIEVTVPQDIIEAHGAGLYLGHALSAIGYRRADASTVVQAPAKLAEVGNALRVRGDAELLAEAVASIPPEQAAAAEAVMERAAEAVAKRKRRTKAEIEADNAAQAQPEPEQPNISTGAERIDPANPEDDAQDAADEAAEAEKVKAAAGGKLTHDDVRAALKGYVTAFGMQAAMEDGPKVITLVVGEGKVKVSDVPDDQDVLAKVIAGIEEMTAKNPFKRDAVAQ